MVCLLAELSSSVCCLSSERRWNTLPDRERAMSGEKTFFCINNSSVSMFIVTAVLYICNFVPLSCTISDNNLVHVQTYDLQLLELVQCLLVPRFQLQHLLEICNTQTLYLDTNLILKAATSIKYTHFFYIHNSLPLEGSSAYRAPCFACCSFPKATRAVPRRAKALE